MEPEERQAEPGEPREQESELPSLGTAKLRELLDQQRIVEVFEPALHDEAKVSMTSGAVEVAWAWASHLRIRIREALSEQPAQLATTADGAKQQKSTDDEERSACDPDCVLGLHAAYRRVSLA
jgi:hypothetical protein